MNKLLLSTILTALFFLSAHAESNKTLTPEQMKKDINYFFDFVERVHPNIYAFTSKEILEVKKKELLERCSTPMDVVEFGRSLAPLNSLFDGHTRIVLDNLPVAITETDKIFFPKPVQLLDGKLYLMQQNNDPGQKQEILSINGVSGNTIYEKLYRTSGIENRRQRELLLEETFAQQLYVFSSVKAPYQVIAKDLASTQTDTILLKAVDAYGISNAHIGTYHCEQLNFRIFPEQSIAVFDINSLRYNLNDEKVKQELTRGIEKAFELIEENKIENVFYDVSRNGGGNSAPSRIFLKALRHDTVFVKVDMYQKVSDDFIELIANYTTNDESQKVEKQRELREEYGPSGKVVKKELNILFANPDKGFSGNVYLIQGPCTYSAGTDFSEWFASSGVGVVIGEETGGQSDNYTEAVIGHLPVTNLPVQCASKYLDFEKGEFGQGWLPDVPVVLNPYKTEYSLEELQHFIKEAEEYKSYNQH